MPRLVHLTQASARRGIERAGIRGSSGYLGLPRSVFAMPVLPDFGVTHQWLRELKRRHGERMIAVHFTAPGDELVLVGHYAKPHASVPLSQAIRRVVDEPSGAEIVLTRGIPKKDVLAIRETATQLVGWTGTPAGEPKWECLCPACVPAGSRDLLRRARAAFERQLLAARKATNEGDRAAAIGACDIALQRARGRLSPAKLLVFARSEDARVRLAVTALLGGFRWVDVEETLGRLLSDPNEAVRKRAASSTFHAAGMRRAWPLLSTGDDDVQATLAEQLVFNGRELGVALGYLEKLAAVATPYVQRAIASDMHLWLKDDDLTPDQRARCERLRDLAV